MTVCKSALPILLTPMIVLGFAAGMVSPVAHAGAKATAALNALTATPSKISLTGRYGEARLLIEELQSDGKVFDVSGKAKYTFADPKIAAIDESGVVRPLKDGKTELVATLGARTVKIPLLVKGSADKAPPRFHADIIPILTRTSCNSGACHGAAQGRGGFKLSLAGFDPDTDYDWITRANLARRITPSQPDNSLFLRKPTLGVVHKGGKRFDVTSSEYRILKDWIVTGMPAPDPKEAQVTKLEVYPQNRTLPIGKTQRYIVTATYNDGVTRDVSAETLFTASDENVAKVTADGEATVVGNGEGAIIIRYQGLSKTTRIISPFSTPQKVNVERLAKGNPIDTFILAKVYALGLEPSPIASDSDLLRRTYLDTIGVQPSPDETRLFLANTDPEKRAKLIDELLNRPEYVDFWALKWGDILKCSRRILSEKGMYSLYAWIRKSVAENKPWNQFAREVLLAQGSTFEEGPANYYRAANGATELAEMTSQVFLGVRMQCAKCHNHPYEKWTQNQYYQMASFFTRVRTKAGKTADEHQVFLAANGDISNPRTKKVAVPTPLDAKPVPATFNGDRREPLVDWITSDKNPFFAREIVNRLWKHFMGRGFVEPVDDLRVSNPPSNEALLDYLAQDFIKHRYDLKYLMRSIMMTQSYQRSAIPTKKNVLDTKFYSHYTFKRLGAEQLMEAVTSATGVAEKFAGYPAGTRATQLPDPAVPSYFLELFGRPARNIACECERTDEPNLDQIIHLMNNTGINGRIISKEGRIAQLFTAKTPFPKVVEDVYLATLARYPTADEVKRTTQAMNKAKVPQNVAEDLLWALVNSKEFLFNH
ncbi:MAG: DUF1549 and DUF1553 domain-containing protein [Armatimonadetes bacterium]|nr:DUF1549 and DUF1553 domain-containing protein [Armatimonadota bacterium]